MSKARELIVLSEDSDASEMESFLKPLGFRPMTGDDYDGFAGAADDSWILNGNWGDMIAEPSGEGILVIPHAEEINFDWERAPLKRVIDALNKDNGLAKAIDDMMASDNPSAEGIIGSKHDMYKDMLAGKLDPNPSKDNPVNNGERWILSMDGHALEKEFSYEKGEEAYKNLKEIVKDHPGVEVTQLGYDDMSVILPAGTQKSQVLELAHRIANALPYETSPEWKEQYGEDVLGDIHTMDDDGAVLDLARGDSADSIKVNKGDKMEARSKAAEILALCAENGNSVKLGLNYPIGQFIAGDELDTFLSDLGSQLTDMDLDFKACTVLNSMYGGTSETKPMFRSSDSPGSELTSEFNFVGNDAMKAATLVAKAFAKYPKSKVWINGKVAKPLASATDIEHD